MMENSLNVIPFEKIISPAIKYEVARIWIKIPIKIRTKKSWLDV